MTGSRRGSRRSGLLPQTDSEMVALSPGIIGLPGAAALKKTDEFITRAASRRIDEPAAGVRLLDTCNGCERSCYPVPPSSARNDGE